MRQLLSSDKTYYFLLLLAIFLRCLSEINNPVLTSDNSIQMEAAKNFIGGGGFSRSWVNAADLNQVHCAPMKLWPVGYPFILVFLNIFTGNLITSAIVFQCIGVILFIAGCLKLLKYFNVSLLYVNLFLLLYAFNSAPFYYLGSTDLFTVSLFLWIIYYTLKAAKEPGYSLKNILIVSVLSFMAAAVRFACIPNLAIIPFFFMLAAFFSKQKIQFTKAILLLVISGFFVLTLYKVFPFDSSRTGFLKVLLSGDLFYSHLQWFDPFPIKGLFFSRPIEFHLPHNHSLILLYRVGLFIASFAFLILILLRFTKTPRLFRYMKGLKADPLNKNILFTLLFISAVAVIIGFISMQSLTTGPEANSFGPSWMPPLWTFVYATRYFIYLMAMVIVLYFLTYFQSESESTFARKMFTGSYCIFFAWAFVYWLFMNYQFYSPKGNGAGSEWVNEKTSIMAFKEIKKIKSEDKNRQIVFAHYKDKMIEGLVTNYSDATPTDDYQAIIKGDFKNSKPLVLVMTMPIALSENENTFLSQHKFAVLSSLKNEQIIKIELS